MVILNATEGEIIIQPDPEPAKDTRINSYYTNSNYGEQDNMKIWSWTIGGTNILSYSLIEFDLSEINEDSQILKAQLFLFHHPTVKNSTLSGSNEVYIERITSEWSEFGVIWLNKPSTTTQNRVIIPATTSDYEDKIVDVTQLVQDIIQNPNESFGFLLKPVYTEPYREMVFSFSDIQNADLRPMLVIDLQ